MSEKTDIPFSLRLTFEERAWLEEQAGHMPVGAYIRAVLFDPPTPRKRTYRKPVKDDETLARLLADLGASRLANNLNQLAKATNSGSLPVTPDTEKAIQTACADVHDMREHLIRALGLRPPESAP